jgi:hypothetical protein
LIHKIIKEDIIGINEEKIVKVMINQEKLIKIKLKEEELEIPSIKEIIIYKDIMIKMDQDH